MGAWTKFMPLSHRPNCRWPELLYDRCIQAVLRLHLSRRSMFMAYWRRSHCCHCCYRFALAFCGKTKAFMWKGCLASEFESVISALSVSEWSGPGILVWAPLSWRSSSLHHLTSCWISGLGSRLPATRLLLCLRWITTLTRPSFYPLG